MDPAYHYWTFNLSPFLFQVKNLSFDWVTTWWGIVGLIFVFGGGFLFSRKSTLSTNFREILQTTLFYVFILLGLLFTLNKMHVNWGLRWYSLMYLIGFVATYLICAYWSRKRLLMLTETMLMNLLFVTIIMALLGARLAYVFIYNWDHYKLKPLEIFATWEGGLSFHGGIVGTLLGIYIMCRKYKVPFFHVGDKIARVVPIGIGMGRIGNFMNGELWGRPIETHVPWGIIFPEAGAMARHPSQLYQSLGEGWALLLTLFILSRFRQREGAMCAYFIIFYSLYRFIVEYFRAADEQVSYFFWNHLSWGPLNAYPGTHWTQIMTMGQLLCLGFSLLGVVFFFLCRKNILEGSQEWIKRNQAFFLRHKEK